MTSRSLMCSDEEFKLARSLTGFQIRCINFIHSFGYVNLPHPHKCKAEGCAYVGNLQQSRLNTVSPTIHKLVLIDSSHCQ